MTSQQPRFQSASIRLTCTLTLTCTWTWRESGPAPCTMHRGSVAVEGSAAYFRKATSTKGESSKSRSGEVYKYDSIKEDWSQLPDCPHRMFSLAVVKGQVIAIGGDDAKSGQDTNCLLGLTQGEWKECYRPMPTRRRLSVAACDRKNLIVAGGFYGEAMVSVVEVMDTESVQWYTAASLPHVFARPTMEICGDSVYLLGGDSDGRITKTKSVLTCSLTALLQSCRQQSPGAELEGILTVWRRVKDIPVYFSTCATLGGELVAVGGHESDVHKPDIQTKTTAVYHYSPSTDSWQIIGHMQTARDKCLVAVLPNNKLMVVGGNVSGETDVDTVEIATI